MKVILLQDVKNLGKKNDIVNVADGYYKNFLLPKKYAVVCSKNSLEHLKEDLKIQNENEEKNIKDAIQLKKQIENITLNFSLKTNSGNVFGSISQKQIIDSLKEKGILISKYMFSNDFQSLKIGKANIPLNLYKNVVAKLTVLVTES